MTNVCHLQTAIKDIKIYLKGYFSLTLRLLKAGKHVPSTLTEVRNQKDPENHKIKIPLESLRELRLQDTQIALEVPVPV